MLSRFVDPGAANGPGRAARSRTTQPQARAMHCAAVGKVIARRETRRQSARPGLTLIELLASSMLATLMMLVVAGLLRTTVAQSKAAERMLQQNPATDILADQLRRDFVNATHIEFGANRVRLYGHLSQDWQSRRPTFRRAEVTYAVMPGPRDSMLVRRETQFSQFAGKQSRLDVLWAGVAALEVIRFDEANEEGGSDESTRSPPGMTSMPSHVLVAIHRRTGEPLLTEDIFHHHDVQ